LLYGDNDGGQRVISRMTLRRRGLDVPGPAGQPDRPWIASAVRHWNIDRPDPR
jgi:hypothetical protein